MAQGHLAKNLGISRQKLTNYLYFAKIPQEIWDVVGNVTKVTSRTACTIFYLSQKGSKYIDALLECADDIRKGIGATSLERLVLSKVKNDATILNYFPLALDDGTVVGTWKNGDFKLNKDLNINKEKFLKHILKFFWYIGVLSKLTEYYWTKDHKYYRLTTQANLFGTNDLICSWGSLYSNRGNYKVIHCNSQNEINKNIKRISGIRKSRGYIPFSHN